MPRGVLVIAHGLGEHSGRYAHLVDWLAGKQISVYSLDHRGHGRSAGKRGHVLSFNEYVEDLSIYINIVRDEHPGLPVFLLGHSMGGVISVLCALRCQNLIRGLILSSPALVPVVEAPRIKAAMAGFLSKYAPGLLVSNELDANYISHDREIVANYIADPLNHDRISTRWYSEYLKSAAECLDRAGEITVPLLVFHGTEDRIVDFSGAMQVYESAASRDKKKLLLEGLYHETMNEVEHERVKVLDVVGKWILSHLGKEKKAGTAKAAARPKKKKPAKKKAVKVETPVS
jgi:lysophospholipase